MKSIGKESFPATLTDVVWNAKNCLGYSTSNLKASPFFGNCTLNSIVFGTGVEQIPAYICYNQTKLDKITFPASVKAIGAYSLKGCSGLKSMRSHIIEPTTSIFGLTDSQYATVPLYVPKGRIDAYRDTLGWADFFNIIEMDGEGKGDINGDESVDGGDVSILLEMVLAGGVSDEQMPVADINADGSVDGGDVSILLEIVLSGE